MKSIRNLCLLGALAAIAACDPYTAENKGQPQILSVFVTNASEAFEATGDAATGFTVSAPSTCTPAAGTTAEATVADAVAIYVKFNKLLDGASIQSTPASCVPANSWLSVAPGTGGDASAAWFSCYNPSSPTATEGSSVVIYPGADVSTGVEGEGWVTTGGLTASSSAAATYVLTGNVKDKQGNSVPVKINFTVNPDAGPVDVTVASGVLTWAAAGCGTATAYNVYKQDATDAKPVLLTATPITATTYTDASPAAGREYFVAPLVGTVETKRQGPFTAP